MASQPDQTNEHRVLLEFEDGVYIKELIHPKDGCQSATVCANCGRDTRDPETTGCYDCKDGFGTECWVQGWVDNMTAEELLAGQVEAWVVPEMVDHECVQLVITGGPGADLIDAERRWRRDVMGDVKDALACGEFKRAWDAITRHEREGYPWAPGAPSRNPDEAREWMLR